MFCLICVFCAPGICLQYKGVLGRLLEVQLFSVIFNIPRFLLNLGMSGKDISDHNHN